MRTAFVICITIFLVQNVWSAQDPTTIVPGRFLGLLELGTNVRAVIEPWGLPDEAKFSSLDSKRDYLRHVGIYKYHKYQVQLWAICGIITEARTQNKSYRTDKGIRVGDPVERAISTYGRDYMMGDITMGEGIIAYNSIGFIFDISKRITTIRIRNSRIEDQQVERAAFDPFGCSKEFDP